MFMIFTALFLSLINASINENKKTSPKKLCRDSDREVSPPESGGERRRQEPGGGMLMIFTALFLHPINVRCNENKKTVTKKLCRNSDREVSPPESGGERRRQEPGGGMLMVFTVLFLHPINVRSNENKKTVTKKLCRDSDRKVSPPESGGERRRQEPGGGMLILS